MARVDEVIGYGTHADRPAAGSAGRLYYETDTETVFRDNGTTWDAFTLAGGGGSLTGYNATLTSNVSLSANSTWYDALSLDLPAGTYLIGAGGHFAGGSVGCGRMLKIYDGSSTIYSAANGGGTFTSQVTCPPTIVTLSSPTTVKLATATDTGAGTLTLKAATSDVVTGNVATQLTALKIA